MKLIKNDLYLLLIDEEAEIKFNDLFLGDDRDRLTESERWKICKNESTEGANYLMCEGVGYQKGYNAFLILAYHPLSKEAKELDLPWLPKPFKEQFSLEDMLDVFEFGLSKPEFQLTRKLKEDFTKFIQSLSTQQLPKEFIPEYQKDWEETTKMLMESMGDNPEDFKYEETLKTITNSEGKEILVGTYKY